ncbi:hypothetical protein GCM10009737_16730 [Nocardioides lentus]|uniref:Hemicentin-1-like von Willebrand factor A domain-containing protein n=2 Tax=Nocardioides lentus TaxID=338077 RepID=A0ABP5AK88_9ACTN
MAFRGSGEDPVGPQSYKSQTSNGWEGPTLKRAFRAYASSSSYTGDLAGVPIVGLSETDGYEAPDAGAGDFFAEFPTDSAVWNGANEGAIAAIRKMGSFQRDQPSPCKRTKWILVGYSQGAMAARSTYEAVGSAWVSSLYLLGDPFQKPYGAGVRGGGRNGSGFYRFNWPSLRTSLDAYYDRKPASATSLCHNNDPICDLGTPLLGPHLNYFTEETEKRTEGAKLASITASAYAAATAPPPPEPVRRDVEIMFAIDSTGSMGPYIDDAVDSARDMTARVLVISPGSAVGVVEFRDHGDDFVARTVQGLTRDVDAVEDALSSLDPDQGGDEPEAVYSGIYEAAAASWSPGSSRSIAVIGDAPAHDPEDVTGYTWQTTVERLRAVATGPARRPSGRTAPSPSSSRSSDGVPRIYGLSDNGPLSSQLADLAEQVGGDVFDIGADGSVGELMEEVVDSTASAPTVVLSASPSVAGTPTMVSATGSTVSTEPATYDFDVDGDGVYDVSGSDPVQYLDLTPGVHVVNVRVVDGDGRASTGSIEIATATSDSLSTPPTVALEGSRVLTRTPLAGRPVQVRLPASDSSFIASLSRGTTSVPAASSWSAERRTVSITPPRSARPGTYVVTVQGDAGQRAELPVRLRQKPMLRATYRVVGGRAVVSVVATSPGGRPRGRILVSSPRGGPVGARLTAGRATVRLPAGVKPRRGLAVRFVENGQFAAARTTARRRD